MQYFYFFHWVKQNYYSQNIETLQVVNSPYNLRNFLEALLEKNHFLFFN
jgi:hypothetical protein